MFFCYSSCSISKILRFDGSVRDVKRIKFSLQTNKLFHISKQYRLNIKAFSFMKSRIGNNLLLFALAGLGGLKLHLKILL